jgi:hypothetical protein
MAVRAANKGYQSWFGGKWSVCTPVLRMVAAVYSSRAQSFPSSRLRRLIRALNMTDDGAGCVCVSSPHTGTWEASTTTASSTEGARPAPLRTALIT